MSTHLITTIVNRSADGNFNMLPSPSHRAPLNVDCPQFSIAGLPQHQRATFHDHQRPSFHGHQQSSIYGHQQSVHYAPHVMHLSIMTFIKICHENFLVPGPLHMNSTLGAQITVCGLNETFKILHHPHGFHMKTPHPPPPPPIPPVQLLPRNVPLLFI